MSELIFVLTATVLVFALFILAFFIKGRSVSDDGPRPTCAHCNCQRSQEQHHGFHEHQKPNGKHIRS